MTRLQVNLPTPDGVLDCYLFEPAGAGPWPGVVLYMDAFGIRADLDVMAARLAGAGYVVAVPNLYHRSGAFPPFDPALVAAGGAERDRFMGMIRSIDGDLVMRDTAAVIAHFDTRPTVSNGPLGTVGYCMGGGYALRAAGVFPERVAAAASFHGGSLATDRPDSPHQLASRMRAHIYVGVAGLDPGFTDEQRQRLDAALRADGVNYEIEIYEGAQHGFAVHNHRVYDRAASERHWERLLALFHAELRGIGSGAALGGDR
ncbi:MAG TPA: dienelactone hydrolase family protein [Vicinamibacterales bacterium]|nr:dienelactone hydrolase family protein [Vicinamibacterales bacterium]